MLRRAPA